MVKPPKNKTFKDWCSKYQYGFTLFSIGAVIFGAGYGLGKYQESITSKLNEDKLIQEYNQQIQKERDEVRKIKIEEANESIDQLKKAVKILQESQNEK
jgi:hypothetical protein